MESFDDPEFRQMINGADIVISDSQVLVWFQRFLNFPNPQKPLRGQQLTEKLCSLAAKNRIKVGFYGGTETSLHAMTETLRSAYPDLDISFSVAPPFRSVTEEEELEYVRQINESGTQILFLGIGCPKQECWMANNVHNLSTVMIGVGAAFDYIAGIRKQPPSWVHRAGLEWFYRLCLEPRRLADRHLRNNPRFVYHCILQRFGKNYP
jgi:N-acetylglucosaminyldiphosphoundecaprenol N-acetyl-beta-D-mannosaminyltransferase